MDVLGDTIARDRRSDRPALSVPAVGRSYDYRRFCTSAWKVGNFLRHLGVREGVGVAVADDPTAEPVLTFYGAASLGAVVRFDPPRTIESDTRALVVPAAEIDGYEVGPATKRVAYRDPPTDPSVSYFERDVWSENPTEPPTHVDAGEPLLSAGGVSYSHGEVLNAARSVVEGTRARIDERRRRSRLLRRSDGRGGRPRRADPRGCGALRRAGNRRDADRGWCKKRCRAGRNRIGERRSKNERYGCIPPESALGDSSGSYRISRNWT